MRDLSLLEWVGVFAITAALIAAVMIIAALADEAVRATKQVKRIRAAFRECGQTPPRFLRFFWWEFGTSYLSVTYDGIGPFPHDPTAPMPQEREDA